MLQNYPEESQTFIKNILDINSSHNFKHEHLKVWDLIILSCHDCECSIQINYNIKTTSFAISDDTLPIFFGKYLTCKEVQIKRLLE
jgi:hypothetical protein